MASVLTMQFGAVLLLACAPITINGANDAPATSSTLFIHVGKAAGGTIKEWLKANSINITTSVKRAIGADVIVKHPHHVLM